MRCARPLAPAHPRPAHRRGGRARRARARVARMGDAPRPCGAARSQPDALAERDADRPDRRPDDRNLMTDSPTPAAPEAATITTDVLLIGGGVAAAAAAAELRTRGFDGSVLLVTRELDPPYERPPVTKELLTGRCTREQLLWGDDAWWAERDVEVRTRCAVTALDTEARRATLSTKETVAFGAALVATGAMVRRLAVDGAGLESVHYLRAPGNAEALRRELEVAERVVVVGGSFIACEVAASVTELGKPCVLVMQEDRPLERQFGAVMGDFIASLLTSKGIELVCGDDVVAFEGAGGGEAEGDGGAAERVAHVVTAGGRRFAADVVVAGVGALPDAMLARRAGLAIGESGGIRCDARLRTSAAGIWAAGDACEYDSVLHGGPVR